MGDIITLSQIGALQKVATEFSILGDDYIFTHITEPQNFQTDLSRSPVRFDGMSWILCFGGSLDFEMNLVPISLRQNSIVVTRPNSFIEIKDVDFSNFDCYFLFISSDFLRDINFDLNIIGSIPAVSNEKKDKSPIINIDAEEAMLLKEYFHILHSNTRNSDHCYSKAIARSLVAALIYQMIHIVTRRLQTDEAERPRSRQSNYIRNFIELVSEHHCKERSVLFYADKLFISPKYLSLLVKEALGRSAAEIIDDYVILEAKNLLRFSGKNIQQISYALNFPNQSSFGKYFKHLVGMSPSEYQRSV